MFEQSLIVDGGARRNPWSFAVSVTVQSVLVAAALAVPLLHVAQLERKLPEVLFLPRPIGLPEAVQKTVARNSTVSSSTILQSNRSYRPFQAPTKIPTQIATGPDLPGAPVFPPTGNGGNGIPGGVELLGVSGLDKAIPLPAPPPQPVTPQPAAQQAPVRVNEGVQSAKLIFGPRPAYPPLAKQARISGTVRLAARISADGHIRDLRVMSGHPMLVPSALDAVGQWVYKPTLLNAQPVEVLTEIMVNFVLSQ